MFLCSIFLYAATVSHECVFCIKMCFVSYYSVCALCCAFAIMHLSLLALLLKLWIFLFSSKFALSVLIFIETINFSSSKLMSRIDSGRNCPLTVQTVHQFGSIQRNKKSQKRKMWLVKNCRTLILEPQKTLRISIKTGFG